MKISKRTLVNKLLLLSLLVCSPMVAQSNSEIEINPLTKGTLYSPGEGTNSAKKNLIILIAGSGPTNRSGNQIGAINNSLKFLAEDLRTKGHSVFSYDKRIFAQMVAGTLDEKTLVFEQFIEDAKDVVNHFRLQKTYDNIIIAGHSEGSLIGMVAAQHNADAYISLAGPGRPIDEILIEQLTRQHPALEAELRLVIDEVKTGQIVEIKNPIIASVFRRDVQPFLLSWMKYNPQLEIKKLKIPVLIINGSNDYQVKVPEAHLLKAAYPAAQIQIIENMNHIFKEVIGDDAANLATYSNAKLPVMPELVRVIDNFIKSL